MMSYGQNEELTVEDLSELVAENSFIGAEPNTAPLPTFAESKERLPQPFWVGHEDVIDCYYKAWEIAFPICGSQKRTPASFLPLSTRLLTAVPSCGTLLLC